MGQKALPAEQTLKWLNIHDATDEPTYTQRIMAAKEEERLYKLGHPQSFSEAINNIINEFGGYILAQKLLNEAREHTDKSWEQIAAEAAHHSYYNGDKRGDGKQSPIHPAPAVKRTDDVPDEPQYDFFANVLNLKRQNPLEAKNPDGLRCRRCRKVIRTSDGRNIHCEESLGGGYVCEYCGQRN